MTEKQRKLFKTILKVVISAVLLYFIFTKISFTDILETIGKANVLFLLVAVFFYIVSKVLNAFRLNLYFHQILVPLSQKSNLKLYLLGMFYNLFLPGGIGGDAYKGYVIQKKFNAGTKKVVTVLILDRLSGMLLIFIYSCALALMIKKPVIADYNWLFYVAAPLSIFVFWMLQKLFFSYVLAVFWKSFLYSALLQAVQLLAVFFIIKALAIEVGQLAYLLVFLLSSMVSVIPLTIGGVGSREVTFLYGAAWFSLDAGSAIAVSFIFFLITALVSLFGIIYHFKKPELTSTIQLLEVN